MMAYIKAAKAFEKLKKAEGFDSPVIMTAGYGWGKSAAAEYYYRRKNPLVIRCGENGRLEKTPLPHAIRQHILIVEDMQWLSDEADIGWLKARLNEGERQIVMLTRGTVPGYLAREDMELGCVRIREEDLALGE